MESTTELLDSSVLTVGRMERTQFVNGESNQAS